MEKRELELWRREKFQELPNVKRRRTLEFCYFATSKALQLASICVCAPIITHISVLFQWRPCIRILGGLNTPPLQTPFPFSLPLTPSATDHCLLSLSSTALLVRGGGRIVTLLSGPPLCPLPFRPGLTPFTVLKSTICITQQSGSERQGDVGQEEERKIGEEKGDDGLGGTAGKGDRTRGICLGVELSVGKYLSNSFHSVKASLLLSSLQTLCLLIFLPPCFTDSFNFYFPLFCNPLRGFPTLCISSLQVFSDNPKSLFP